MAEYSKLGYGQFNKIDTAITNGVLDAKDIIITEDTSEFIYIRDDKTKQIIRSRIRLFESQEAAVAALNEDASTYAGEQIGIMGDDGKYQIYIVQNGAEGFEPESIVANSTGLLWQEF